MHGGRMGSKVALELLERDRPVISVIAHADGAALQIFLLIRKRMGL